ncbi:MAG: aspartate carbamoyltransferase catalytic subunit [Candidatus Omnitrophica bacterium]|jgi:aspartate carbamoyltransferase catalytic subunit|nr:aspartate carbamoyltransferase catalytic subunit [Candidatus Omnitrophota bacterium]
MKWNKRSLLSIEELSGEEINYILQTAYSFKEISLRPVKKVPALRGKTIVNLFFEPSTRTKTSFELAAKRLSADVLNFEVTTSSISKGETIVDTVKNIEAMKVDCFIVRHKISGAAEIISKETQSAVINAGDGCHEHPTQALLDLFTLKEYFGELKGLKVAIIGDIFHSRVARSNIWGLIKLGANVKLCAPATFIPMEIEKTGVSIFYKIEQAIKNVDVVYLLRIQKERQEENFFPSWKEYASLYEFNISRFNSIHSKFVLMHPGPMNRGIEIKSDVVEKGNSLILKQVTNGIAVRMAVLYLTVGQVNN